METSKNTSLPETGFVRLPTVLKVVPVSRATWWQGIKDGRYPRGHKLGARTTGWRCEDIRELINRLSAEPEVVCK